jgi:ATP-dependent helicase STH1/SNF2
LITRPIALDIIEDRVHSSHYASLVDFEADLKLMFANARLYNQEGSDVWNDAAEMEK